MNTSPDSLRAARIADLGYDYGAQPTWVRSHCNLCGGERFVTLVHRDRYGYADQYADGYRDGFGHADSYCDIDRYSDADTAKLLQK